METGVFAFPTIDVKRTGARIREQRKAKHITVQRIQMYMGFTEPQAIYKWQRGDSLPSLDNLLALSKLFGTTMEDILVINDDEGVLPHLYLYPAASEAPVLFLASLLWLNSNMQFSGLHFS